MRLSCRVLPNLQFVFTGLPLVLLILSFVYRGHLLSSAAHKRHRARTRVGVKTDKLRSDAIAQEEFADRLVTYNFALFYVLFPSNSARIFATLQCETLDDPQQTSFLRKDFSVDCKDPFHAISSIYAIAMIAIYPLGIPLVYAWLLFHKHATKLRLLRSLEVNRVLKVNQERADQELTLAIHEDGNLKTCVAEASTSVAEASTSTSASASHPSRCGQNKLQRQSSTGAKSFKNLMAATQGAGGRVANISRTSSKSSMKLDATEMSPAVKQEIDTLQAQEDKLRSELPDYVQKLIQGYELRVYYFELFECARKLAIVCAPVFFEPSGSTAQLTFGLCMCFLTFGAYMVRLRASNH